MASWLQILGSDRSWILLYPVHENHGDGVVLVFRLIADFGHPAVIQQPPLAINRALGNVMAVGDSMKMSAPIPGELFR